jgi:catechol 1,2-dioxygenase
MSNRTAELVGDLLARVHALIAQNDVSYEEYRAAKEWLIELGEAGE